MSNETEAQKYLDMDLLRFTTAGSVDDGKSTLIGRLLYDSKSIFDDQMEKLKVGRKKYITVSYYDAINKDKLKKIPDVTIRKQYSPSSFMLEADTTNKYLDGIIKEIRLGTRIKDIEIKEPPVTEIIKKLYKK